MEVKRHSVGLNTSLIVGRKTADLNLRYQQDSFYEEKRNSKDGKDGKGMN